MSDNNQTHQIFTLNKIISFLFNKVFKLIISLGIIFLLLCGLVKLSYYMAYNIKMGVEDALKAHIKQINKFEHKISNPNIDTSTELLKAIKEYIEKNNNKLSKELETVIIKPRKITGKRIMTRE